MTPYNTLLIAIDGSPSSVKVLERAVLLANNQAKSLHVIHVIEPLALAYGADIPMDVTELQQNLIDQAKATIYSLTETFPIPPEQIYVELGSIEKTIHEKVADLDAEIIVMGSHMRGGWGILLGSTARGILPGSNCDVLAVKIHD